MKYLMLELRPWMLDINNDLYQMLQEIPQTDEFGQTNEYFGKTKSQIKKEICTKMKIAYSLSLPENILPNEVYIFYADGKPVCIGGLRFKLNDYWLRHGGNIWYKTRPSERHKGFATIFAKMLCERAKCFGLKEVLAQCNINNYGSNKVLQNNNFTNYTHTTHTNFYKKQI